MIRLLRKLTVEQWAAIDRDYRDRELPDSRVMWILLTITLCLVLPRYFGNPSFIDSIPAAKKLFATWPHPTLWPKLYWAGFKFINYLLVPILAIKFLLKESVLDHGLRPTREGKVWLLYLAMFLVVVPMAYGASFTDSFIRTYPKYRYAGASWEQLIAWEFGYGFQFFALEFFFRGFLLFALARYIGSAAIFVMVVPYAMIHFSKPLAETLGSVLAGMALGTIALRTRSIYGGVAVHCGVAWAMDLFAMLRKGQIQHLFEE
ncbi:MAG: CPBP family intramembrane glutamic endopeptidase [Myxococcota bacterium]